jgi:hypothetical protein
LGKDRQYLRSDAGVNEFLDEVARALRIVVITDDTKTDYACRLTSRRSPV